MTNPRKKPPVVWCVKQNPQKFIAPCVKNEEDAPRCLCQPMRMYFRDKLLGRVE